MNGDNDNDMNYEIMHGPSFAVARVLLQQGESVRAESGAMASMSPSVEMQSQSGGLGKMFGRILSGESAFQTMFTATHGPGEVVLAPKTPGEVRALTLQGKAWMITSGAYLASDPSVELGTAANMKNFFGGEGVFMVRASGAGTVLVNSFGAIREIELQAGQSYIIDTGHLVAFEDGMGYQLQKAAKSLLGSFTSGEGIVAVMSGPGRVLMQTHQPQGLAQTLAAFIPRSG